MKIIQIQPVGTAGIRVVTDEQLPNGRYSLDLFAHFTTTKTQDGQMDSAIAVRDLLAALARDK
jgi:hypothetical protein